MTENDTMAHDRADHKGCISSVPLYSTTTCVCSVHAFASTCMLSSQCILSVFVCSHHAVCGDANCGASMRPISSMNCCVLMQVRRMAYALLSDKVGVTYLRYRLHPHTLIAALSMLAGCKLHDCQHCIFVFAFVSSQISHAIMKHICALCNVLATQSLASICLQITQAITMTFGLNQHIL